MSIVAEREVELCIELGRTQLPAGGVKRLQRGSTIPLDGSAGDPVEVHADGQLIARGELVVRDGLFFVRVLELIRHAPAS